MHTSVHRWLEEKFTLGLDENFTSLGARNAELFNGERLIRFPEHNSTHVRRSATDVIRWHGRWRRWWWGHIVFTQWSTPIARSGGGRSSPQKPVFLTAIADSFANNSWPSIECHYRACFNTLPNCRERNIVAVAERTPLWCKLTTKLLWFVI